MSAACDAAVLLADSVDARPPAGASPCDDSHWSRSPKYRSRLGGLFWLPGVLELEFGPVPAVARAVVADLAAAIANGHDSRRHGERYSQIMGVDPARVAALLERHEGIDTRKTELTGIPGDEERLRLAAERLRVDRGILRRLTGLVTSARECRRRSPVTVARARERHDGTTRTSSRASGSDDPPGEPPSDSRSHAPLSGGCR